MKKLFTKNDLSTFLYSKSKEEQKKKAIDYLLEDAAKPLKGSEFAHKLRFVKYLLRIPKINKKIFDNVSKKLIKQGHDALLLEYNNEIIGRTAFQIKKDKNFHVDALHVYGVQVRPDVRGRHLGTFMQEQLIKLYQDTDVELIRFSKGGDRTLNKIVEYFSKKEHVFNIRYINNQYFKLNL